MSDDQFYEDCLGCGVRFFQGFFAPSVDGTSIDGVGTGIQAADSIASTDIAPINGTPNTFPFPAGCNGLKFDCETGAIWYDTPGCHLRLVNRGGVNDFINETAVASGSNSIFTSLAEPLGLGGCYDGMTAVVIGYIEIYTMITASQITNAPASTDANPNPVDPEEFFNAYDVRYQFTLSSGGQTVFSENLNEGRFAAGYQFSKRCLTHTIPFTACYDFNQGLNQEFTATVSNRFRNSANGTLVDIQTSFTTTSNAFILKER